MNLEHTSASEFRVLQNYILVFPEKYVFYDAKVSPCEIVRAIASNGRQKTCQRCDIVRVTP